MKSIHNSKLQFWSDEANSTLSPLKKKLAYLSLSVREEQLNFFLDKFKPVEKTQILNVGSSPAENLIDTNFFEKKYPFPQNLSIASVENCQHLVKKYSLKKFHQVAPERYPFKNKQFEIITSWATLEHVGGEKEQKHFLKELDRIGKKVFLTTPYKYCFYEPHTELFLLHWLPNKTLRKILKFLGKNFWAEESNWRSLSIKQVKKILPNKKYKIYLYKMFGIIPSHLLIYKL